MNEKCASRRLRRFQDAGKHVDKDEIRKEWKEKKLNETPEAANKKRFLSYERN